METKENIGKAVRVSIPASVASDIGSLKKSFGTILDKLGCPACCSGHNIYLELQRDHIFERDVKTRLSAANPIRNRFAKESATVNVAVQPAFANKIENVFDAIDRIAEITGHVACATGCDMFLNLEQQFALDEKLNVSERVMAVG